MDEWDISLFSCRISDFIPLVSILGETEACRKMCSFWCFCHNCTGLIRLFIQIGLVCLYQKRILHRHHIFRSCSSQSVLRHPCFGKTGYTSQLEIPIVYQITSADCSSCLQLCHVTADTSLGPDHQHLRLYCCTAGICRNRKCTVEQYHICGSLCEAFTVCVAPVSVFVLITDSQQYSASFLSFLHICFYIHGKCISFSFFQGNVLAPSSVACSVRSICPEGTVAHFAVFQLCVNRKCTCETITFYFFPSQGFCLDDRVFQKLYHICLQFGCRSQAVHFCLFCAIFSTCRMSEAVLDMDQVSIVVEAIDLAPFFIIHKLCAVITIG